MAKFSSYNNIFAKIYIVLFITFLCASLSAKNENNYGLELSLSGSVNMATFIDYRLAGADSNFGIKPFFIPLMFDENKPLLLKAVVSMDINWLNSYYSSFSEATFSPKISDLSLSASAPGIYLVDKINLSVTPYIVTNFGTSKISRAIGRVFSAGVGSELAFNLSNFFISGDIFVNGWLHKSSEIQTPNNDKYDANIVNSVLLNPSNDVIHMDGDDRLIFDCMERNKNENNNCILAGRQTVGNVNSTLSFGVSGDNHNLTFALGWLVSLKRPLQNKPGLTSAYASKRNFNDSLMGSISYGYFKKFKPFSLSMSLGMLTIQDVFTSDGKFKFPFVDLVSPRSGATQIFLSLSTKV